MSQSYVRSKGREYYIRENGKEIYISLPGKGQIYAFDFNKKREEYALNEANQPYFAQWENGEFYAVDLVNGFQKFPIINNMQIYAKSSLGNEMFPFDFYRQEKIARNREKIPYYPTLINGETIYPKSDWGHETPVFLSDNQPLLAIDKYKFPKAPLKRSGEINYQINAAGHELLFMHEGYYFFGRDVLGNQIYPKLVTGDSYYPIDDDSEPRIAQNMSRDFVYALDKNQKIIFPKQNGIEFYIPDISGNTYWPLVKQAKHFERYIESQEYPVVKTNIGTVEFLINDQYISNKYPLDACLNERTNSKGELISELGPPITNDGYIIVTNINNDYRNHPFLLYRPALNTYDFLTQVKSKRASNQELVPYKILDLSPFTRPVNSLYYYIVAGLTILVMILTMVLLLIKRKQK